MHVFYTPDILTDSELPAEEAGHCVRVLRLNIGDEILLTDGKGYFYKAAISAASGKRCQVRIIEKTFQENMETAFSGDTVTSDADKEAYIDAVREVYKLARYEVTDSKETEEGFLVTVCAEPCTVFENLEAGVTEKMTLALEIGTYTENKAVSYVTEYLNEALADNEYGEKTEIEVTVTIDGDGVCQISENDLLKVEEALFPGVV